MNMFKKNGGFTLVELIVVIAILAILAGVAVPAYSGYLNKAKEAADTQVISAVNTAIKAATATNNAVADASVSNGKVVVDFTGDTATNDAANDYALFIEGTDTTLKYYDDIELDASTNLFVGVKTESKD